MAKITSGGRLYRSEVVIDTDDRDINLVKTTTGNQLSDDGVSLQALYSYLKNVWRVTDFQTSTAGESIDTPSANQTTITFDDVTIAAASITAGQKVRIKTAGNTVWTDFGAPDSTVGTVFVSTSGSVTGTGEATIAGNSLDILPGMKVQIASGTGALTGGEATVLSVTDSAMVIDQNPSTPTDATTVFTVINHLIEYPFPLVAITPEQFEFSFGWTMLDNTARKLLRDAGWQELDTGAVDGPKYTGIISLGTIDTVTLGAGADAVADATLVMDSTTGITVGMEARVQSGTGTIPADTKVVSIDSPTQITLSAAHGGDFDGNEVLLFGDRVYYAFYDTNNETWTTPVNFDFLGPVNEAVLVDDAVNDAGDFTNQVLSLFIRTEGKTYGKSATPDIGIPDAGGTGAGNINFQVYRFPLSEGGDLDYLDAAGTAATSTDVEIEAAQGAGGKYDAVVVATTADATSVGTTINVTTTTGIIAGSYVYSIQDGGNEKLQANTRVVSINAGVSVVVDKAPTTDLVNTDDIRFVNGPHIIYHNLDQASGDYFSTDLSNANSQFGVTINARDGSALNGQLTLKELYSWVQYQLRQSGTIDFDLDIEGGTAGTQLGQTSDSLVQFVGSTLQSKNLLTPSSAAWGVGNLDRATVTDGTGVLFYNFTGSTVNVALRDNTGVLRVFPILSDGTIAFGGTSGFLLQDAAASFTMFFTYSRQHAETLSWSGTNAGVGTITRDAGNFTYDVPTGSYLKFTGFTGAGLEGVFEVTTGINSGVGDSISVTFIDDLSNQGLYATSDAAAAGNLQFNPVDSPDAIIVLDATSTEIQGTLASGVGTPALTANGATEYAWTFAYSTNNQPGVTPAVVDGENRPLASDTPVTVRAVGTDKAQWVSQDFTITSGQGQTFTVLSAQERNYAA